MISEPRIQVFPRTRLAGLKTSMSFAANRTRELWQNFMPKRHLLQPADNNLFSVEVYDRAFFEQFDPTRAYEKWAAAALDNTKQLPTAFEELVIPEGKYAVFTYKGASSEAASTYQYIYAQWIPQSNYQLDHRPHFAIMGEKYRHDAPN